MALKATRLTPWLALVVQVLLAPACVTLPSALSTAVTSTSLSASPSDGTRPLLCACNHQYCSGDKTCRTDGLCFVSLKRRGSGDAGHGEDAYVRVLRCLDKVYLIPPERPFHCEYNHKQNHTYVSRCCKDKDFCNADLQIDLAPQTGIGAGLEHHSSQESDESISTTTIFAIVVPCTLLLLVLGMVLYLVTHCQQRANCRKSDPFNMPWGLCCRPGFYQEVESIETQSTYPVSSSSPSASLQDFLSMTTGSGSGLPLLIQRSVARQISLVRVIGKGRFGEVWKGQWRGEQVAVKIFSSTDEKSWFREVEIYQTVMLRHPNILGFIAADNKDSGLWTQLWLVMEFMENGSLCDFLRLNTVSTVKLLQMSHCIATGLAHLHMEIVGTHGKPAIAHRDIKSKNILVRANGDCAIGDLGLAVKYNHETNVIDLPQNARVGTKRYLAPEILDESLNTTDFEAFKRADIYSLGLVLWEISSRCIFQPQKQHVDAHKLPYVDIVGEDPSLEEMRKVVCIDGARPDIPSSWNSNKIMSRMTTLMSECWYENQASRVTALRVKKTLSEMQSNRNG